MALGCGANLAKIILIIVNIIFLVRTSVLNLIITRCHAIAGRTARCRYKFRHNGIVHAVTVVQHGFLV